MTKEELEKKRYFVLYLKNGEVIDFDKECCYLNNSNKPVIYFQTTKEAPLTLMVVPRKNILYIKSEAL